jgi:integrase
LRYLFGIFQRGRRATGDHGGGVLGAGILGEPDEQDHTPVLVGLSGDDIHALIAARLIFVLTRLCPFQPLAHAESAWQTHVSPRWAATRLSDIRFSDVAARVAELSARCGAVMVRRAHSILARILDNAVRDRMLTVNPARGVKLPRATKRRNVYLTAAQLHALATEAGDYGSLVLLLGTTGLRWGETAALTVIDVDFLRRKIDVHRNAVAVGARVILGTLKSGEARTVPLAGFVVDQLAATSAGQVLR